jgi:hypothetical protein
MAEFKEKYGWHWTDEERQIRQRPLRRLRALLDKVQEQTFRIGQLISQFKVQAEGALHNLKNGVGALARMDLSNRGRKYQPLSPQQFDQAITTLPELLKPWDALVASPGYVAAVQESNRRVRAHNRVVSAHNRIIMAQQEAMLREFDNVLRLVDAGDLGGALDLAAQQGIL